VIKSDVGRVVDVGSINLAAREDVFGAADG